MYFAEFDTLRIGIWIEKGSKLENFFVYNQEKKNQLITSLTKNLTVLRAQAEISQEQLATAVNISRQTYSSFETQKRQMSWPVYMALILYFDSNKKTKDLLHTIVDVPEEIVE